jgi:cellulose synthase/poly-beta-1,6-N-acetylglucosamine synthase-like glycosyltransferase
MSNLVSSAAPRISVIVATFNEEATIERCVRRILKVFPSGCEVLVVDGGSDRTGEIVKTLSDELTGLRYIRSGRADVVLGSRFMRGSKRLAGSTTWLRTFGNKTTSLYASVLFFQQMTDVLAGMMAWSRHTIQTFEVRSDNYSYEVEIPVKALLHKLRVVDVPVTTDARQGGVSCVNVVVDGITLLFDITRFRLGLK